MKKIFIFLLAFTLLYSFQSCKKSDEPIVEFQTSAGLFKVKLFKETPQHRDNFIHLVKDGYFNDLIFHRAMKDYLIQTGDPNSKTASKNRLLGTGGPGYTINAEINYPTTFHKKGMLTAARLPDADNPKKASNGSQFCIIIGKQFTSEELDTLELNAYNRQLDKAWRIIVAKNREEITAISLTGDSLKLSNYQDSLIIQAKKLMNKEEVFFFTPEQREAYTTLGGAPHMDNEYTIFGEVIEGIEIAEQISLQAVDMNNRPLEDIRIISTKIIE